MNKTQQSYKKTSESSGLRGSFGQQQAMMPDQNVENCSKCLRKFTIWVRKHHCRMCQRIFCQKCSAQKINRVERDVQKMRICVNCEKLQSEFKKNLQINRKIMNVDQNFIDSSQTNNTLLRSKVSMDRSQLSSNKFNTTQNMDDDENDISLNSKLKKIKQSHGVNAASQLLMKKASMY